MSQIVCIATGWDQGGHVRYEPIPAPDADQVVTAPCGCQVTFMAKADFSSSMLSPCKGHVGREHAATRRNIYQVAKDLRGKRKTIDAPDPQ